MDVHKFKDLILFNDASFNQQNLVLTRKMPRGLHDFTAELTNGTKEIGICFESIIAGWTQLGYAHRVPSHITSSRHVITILRDVPHMVAPESRITSLLRMYYMIQKYTEKAQYVRQLCAAGNL